MQDIAKLQVPTSFVLLSIIFNGSCSFCQEVRSTDIGYNCKLESGMVYLRSREVENCSSPRSLLAGLLDANEFPVIRGLEFSDGPTRVKDVYYGTLQLTNKVAMNLPLRASFPPLRFEDKRTDRDKVIDSMALRIARQLGPTVHEVSSLHRSLLKAATERGLTVKYTGVLIKGSSVEPEACSNSDLCWNFYGPNSNPLFELRMDRSDSKLQRSEDFPSELGVIRMHFDPTQIRIAPFESTAEMISWTKSVIDGIKTAPLTLSE